MVSLFALALTACGGGGGGASSSNPVTQPTPTATAQINASTTQVPVGNSVTLSWTSTNAQSCTASGGWSGTQGTSGSHIVQPNTIGTSTYSITCGTATSSATVTVLSDYVSVPDPVFADALSRLGYSVSSGQLLMSDALKITNLCITSWVGSYGTPDQNNVTTFVNSSVPDNGVKCAYTTSYIVDTTGLESMINLKTFRIEMQRFSSINISTLTGLTFFSLWGNPLTSLDVSHNTNVTIAGISQTSLTSVDFSALHNLVEIDAGNGPTGYDSNVDPHPFALSTNTAVVVTGLSSVVLPSTSSLRQIDLSFNELSSVDFAHTPGIVQLALNGNKFTALDLSMLPNLNYFSAGDSSYLTIINLTGLTGPFYRLYVQSAPNITSIHVKDPTVTIGGGYTYLSLPSAGNDAIGLPIKGIGSPTSTNAVFVDSSVTFSN